MTFLILCGTNSTSDSSHYVATTILNLHKAVYFSNLPPAPLILTVTEVNATHTLFSIGSLGYIIFAHNCKIVQKGTRLLTPGQVLAQRTVSRTGSNKFHCSPLGNPFVKRDKARVGKIPRIPSDSISIRSRLSLGRFLATST